jgi:hypothetical protein
MKKYIRAAMSRFDEAEAAVSKVDHLSTFPTLLRRLCITGQFVEQLVIHI